MTRNNADFQGGRNGMVDAFHVTTKANRASIEKKGLIAQGRNIDYDTGKANFGVFGSTDVHGVEEHASVYGNPHPDDIWDNHEKYGKTFQEAWDNAPRHGGDIYKFSVPREDTRPDDWTTNSEAIKVTRNVQPHEIERVGHVTPNDEVHWHKEEECPNG